MIKIKPIIKINEEGEQIICPSSDIPYGYKVRFINNIFECIKQNDDWDDKSMEL